MAGLLAISHLLFIFSLEHACLPTLIPTSVMAVLSGRFMRM